ncbi:neutral peptidase B [Bacillus pakistanensis]|uniref:Neutral metalloproteinase n=1 Tax=Rossellomorea pakistanensis TaxID=992288 RepID=A0ABS2NJT0_9BACI|nr:neutral peptidase B [Bacillus pakistanensis]
MKKKILSYTLALSLGVGGLSATGLTANAEESKTLMNEKYQTPSYIIENWEAPKSVEKKAKSSISKKDVAYAYLKYKSKQFKLAGDMKEKFKVVDEEKDKETGTHHIKLVEQHDGVPIFGSDQTITLNEDYEVQSFFGQVVPNLEDKKIPTKASISGDKAVEIAKKDIEKQIGKVEKYDADVTSEKFVYEHDGKFYLSYLVKASTSKPEPGFFHYFVDATNGEVINSFNAIDHVTGFGKGVDGEREKFEITKGEDGNYFLFDGTRGSGVHTFDAKNMDPFLFNLFSQLLGYTGEEITSGHKYFSDPAAVDAHVNAGEVYDYYKETFNRDSFDDAGAKLISSVHVGEGWNNAAWNGVQMMYGDGDGSTFIPLSGALDVIAHELTHAVTTSTADLVYENEPGALNEAYSDVLGSMVDRDDWLMGEDVYTPGVEGDALRSLEDPTSVTNGITGPYPDHYSKLYIGTADNGGVHINSSIINKAAYLLSEGGTHYGVTVEGVGREATEQIYYRTLTKYLTSTSDFSMARQASIQSAIDLYGEGSKEVTAVEKSFDAVGIQ